MLSKAILFLAINLAWIAPAISQTTYPEGPSDVFDRGCGDDDGIDRCDASVQQAMRELYGVSSAEELSAERRTVRRVMFVDGYGNDVAMISASRGAESGPLIRVVSPLRNSQSDDQPLTAFISNRVWGRISEAAENFDQRLVSETADQNRTQGDAITICLHGWFVVAETIDPSSADDQTSLIRRDAEHACANGLAVPFAFELAHIAADNLPECSGLVSVSFRNDVERLALCHRLRGDRIAAADAYRLVREIQRAEDFSDRRLIGQLFDYRARALVSDFAQLISDVQFYPDPPHARDADEAVVRGLIVRRSPDDDESQDQVANISFELIRSYRDFVILSYETSEWRPLDQ